MSAARKAGLGRGLSALLDDIKTQDSRLSQYIPIAQIAANPRQPRRVFNEAALQELRESIAARGVLQPILIRPIASGRYVIIAGERRWRVAQSLGFHDIPAIVREADESEALEIGIVENIQRADLNAIEEAISYRRLIDEFKHTQEAVGEIVGRSRSHVANLLRLLDLPEPVRGALENGAISMGHARALLAAGDPVALMREVIAKGLSVRETEARASRAMPTPAAAAREEAAPRDADLVALERQLAGALGLKVAIAAQGSSGRVELRFRSLDQLDMICQRLTGGRV